MNQSREIQEVMFLLQANHSDNDEWIQLQKNKVAGYHRKLKKVEETILE